MSTKTIPWNDGNGNIVLTYNGAGNGTITVTSDTRNSKTTARSQNITVKTVNGTKSRVVTVRQAGIDYSKQYLTFTALEMGTFSLVVPAGITSTHITGGVSYSIDNGATWITTAITSSAQTITTPTINAGGKVLWKAVANQFATSTSTYCKFQATGNFAVSGNIMSLEYGDNFVGQTALKNYTYSMSNLFRENTKVISAENLILPATTLKVYCYYGMFYGCTSLTTAPVLPATTLVDRCYQGMFSNCTSLTTAPKLPATTLATYCYQNMFYGCSSLTTAPSLPATTLASNCYYQMFRSCSKLTTAPKLPATTLTTSCYYQMFHSCSKLNSITCLATDISATSCTSNWMYNVAASGTFTKAASMTSWTTGTSGIPSGWIVNDYQ